MIEQAVLDRAWQRQRQRVILVGGVILIMPVVGALIALTGVGDRSTDRNLAVLMLIEIGIGVAVLALFLAVVYVFRRRGIIPAPLLGLDKRQRKRVLRAVRTGRHLSGLEEAVALDSARRQVSSRWWGWSILAIAVLYVGVWLTTPHHGVFRTALLVYIVAFGVAGPFLATRAARRARAYLETEPEPVA